MTSKLTIEQAKRLRNDFECWQQDYDPKDDKEQYDMFGRGMAAMDMLIAGMYQEPVAYTDERNLGYIDRGRETAYLWGKQNSEAGDVPLYRHAQQPVVLDDLSTFEAAIEECKTCDSIDEHAWNHGVLAVIAKYESCRAAMLQGAENAEPRCGNSPVIPDGYVMVPREPTPEMLEVINEAIKSMRGSAATYARVLAAAPQEVPDGK